MKLTAIVLTASLFTVARAETPQPKPAFPGQTKAPAPAKPSPGFTVETISGRIGGAWSLVFLPDGNFLVTEGIGTMRIVRPDGVVSAPIAGVPPVKVIAAQGLHDVLLDPRLRAESPALLHLLRSAPRRRRRALAHRVLL